METAYYIVFETIGLYLSPVFTDWKVCLQCKTVISKPVYALVPFAPIAAISLSYSLGIAYFEASYDKLSIVIDGFYAALRLSFCDIPQIVALWHQVVVSRRHNFCVPNFSVPFKHQVLKIMSESGRFCRIIFPPTRTAINVWIRGVSLNTVMYTFNPLSRV